MTTATIAGPTAPRWTSQRLSNGVAFALLTSILVSLLASSSAPTPLYATYQAQWGFSPETITVIFGVYAVAVLASLLVFGSLSDRIAGVAAPRMSRARSSFDAIRAWVTIAGARDRSPRAIRGTLSARRRSLRPCPGTGRCCRAP